MNDVPFRIMQLCAADKCAIDEVLKEARNKTTISELIMEYENWLNFMMVFKMNPSVVGMD